MNLWKKMISYVCAVMLMLTVFSVTVMAGGPPLKDKVCDTCHKDSSKILPKPHPDVEKGKGCLTCHAPDPAKAEPTKFSTAIHKTHKGEKTKLECGACHAL